MGVAMPTNVSFVAMASYSILFQVRKGLETLYKKVEKHLCDEENLVQVRRLCYCPSP